MTYRLYTERFANLGAITSTFFDAFTIVDAVGYWRGVKEDSAVIEIGTSSPRKVRELAEAIRQANHQQAVRITSTDETEEMIDDTTFPSSTEQASRWALS